MKVNIFKNEWLFKCLEQYNRIVTDVCAKHTIIRNTDERYDPAFHSSSWWFNPENLYLLSLPRDYPEQSPIVKDKKFNLKFYAPNHASTFFISFLYANRKDVLIEDYACGDARLAGYLSKIGFNNWSLFDNFTQLSRDLFLDMTETFGVKYALNDRTTNPTIINLIGYPGFLSTVHDNTEMVLLYENQRTLKDFEASHADGFTMIATDSDEMIYVYARNDKAQEFTKRLEDYEKGIDFRC